jgi:hypothetical protein
MIAITLKAHKQSLQLFHSKYFGLTVLPWAACRSPALAARFKSQNAIDEIVFRQLNP